MTAMADDAKQDLQTKKPEKKRDVSPLPIRLRMRHVLSLG